MSTVPDGRFGGGGARPWSRALRSAATGDLWLVPERAPDRGPERLDVSRWSEPADDADRTALHAAAGPVLDVGCGPGRMVRAALDAGLAACGIDAEPAAVAHCRALGLPVLHRSVFDPVPHEGTWGTVLLLDGNVGIGGDPAALLARCRRLTGAGGATVVETDPDPTRDEAGSCRLVGPAGRSDAFPWSFAGLDAVLAAARAAELTPEVAWSVDGRRFVRLLAV